MEHSKDQKLYLYIAIAFIFSIAVRMVWVYHFYGYEPFMWNDQFMINTNDGYYWAEGARDIIQGSHQEYDRSPVESLPSIVTAIIYKLLPFQFETIIFYLSIFLSSLVVIPIILIAKSLKNIEMGFIAALFGSIVWSYYNRTLAGYYDTDMLNIVFPMFLLWSLMLAFETKEEKYLLYSALEIIAYRSWYPQSYSLEFAFFTIILFYTLYRHLKQKKDVSYEILLLIFILISMMNIHGLIRLVIVTVFYFLLKKDRIDLKWYRYILGLSIAGFFLSGGFSPIWAKLQGYVFQEDIKISKDELALHFFSVKQTIREAGKIPFETFANRISGDVIIFILSFIGYILLLKRYPLMLLSLPMVGLGFLAYVGGLRFTIYAVPIFAFGIAFLIVEIAKFFRITLFKYIFIIISVLLILLPNLWHAWIYKVPTVFVHNEVKVLDDLKKVASREDYVVAWWDYGYPIRYYSDVKTLIDGGVHGGDVNFPVSYALTHNQLEAAKLARLDVEYTEKRLQMIKNEEFQKDDPKLKRSIFAQMMIDRNFKDPNLFLDALVLDSFKLPKKTRDIYFYLPERMLGIFPTVTQFSNIDLMTGKKIKDPLFMMARPIKKKGSVIELRYGPYPIFFDLARATVTIGNKKMSVGEFIVTRYTKDLKLEKNIQRLSFVSNISIIYMESSNRFLILDNEMANSTYIQLFVLENYDPKIFEPVVLTPLAKVYKLKL